MQQNWTGSVAIYCPTPTPPIALAQPVKGISNAKISRGVWLKASSDARLRIHASQDPGTAAAVSLHLQDHLLLQQPLCDAYIKLLLLPCEHTSILVLDPRQQVTGCRPHSHV